MFETPEDLHTLTATGSLLTTRRTRGLRESPVRAGHGRRADQPHLDHERGGLDLLDRLTAPVQPAPQPGASGYGLDIGAHADLSLVTYARRYVAHDTLGSGASLDESFTIEVLTSELVTNAVVHGLARGYVGVRTSCSDGEFTVAVSDQNPQLPILRHPHPDDPSGRGLHMVHTLATAWGIDPATTGKTVWFTLRLAHGHDRPARDA